MKVKAAVIYKAGEPLTRKTLTLDDEPRDNEVLVKVHASSICHSDELVRSTGIAFTPPVVLGHEGAGVVEKVGANVTRVKVGDHVVMTVPSCGECEFCKRGEYLKCVKLFPMQISRDDGSFRFHDEDGTSFIQMMGQGSFSEYTMVHESSCVVVDPELPFRIAAPVGCGFSTGSGTVLNYLKPSPDDVVAVFGVGSTGAASIMGAKLAGCKTIIAVSRSDAKLEFAKFLGATHLVNSTELEKETGHAIKNTGGDAFMIPYIYPVTEELKRITGGKGVDYAIVTAPSSKVVMPAIFALAAEGECCITASLESGIVEAPLQFMQDRNAKISSCGMGKANKFEFFNYLLDEYKKGEYPIDKLLVHYKFEDINKAFEDMEAGVALKPVMTWE